MTAEILEPARSRVEDARRRQFDAARDHLAAVEGLVAKGTLPAGQQSFAPQRITEHVRIGRELMP